VDLKEIDFVSEVQAPLAHFYATMTDSRETVIEWRQTTAEQALYYLDHRRELVARYAGEYILLQDGEVIWHDTSSRLRASRRDLARGRHRRAMWLKYVDPDEAEGEHYEVYERALASVQEAVSANHCRQGGKTR
jgi:hypothetical protein